MNTLFLKTSSEDDTMEKNHHFFLSPDSFLCLFLKQNGKLGGEMHVKLIVPQNLSPIGFLLCS